MSDIRILFYTDFFSMVQPASGWSITRLIKMVHSKSNGLANVSFTLVNRHAKEGLQKLTSERLKDFEELWVFGFIEKAEPPFTLDSEEQDAVEAWMNHGGGVLITGDHSITRDPKKCLADHDTFFAHGRAIGDSIRRARQMRDWAGPPTACDVGSIEARDNFNTEEGDDPDALDSLLFDLDSTPQRLLKEPIMHPLFIDGAGGRIRTFPDHQHEGKLSRLEQLDGEWPKGSAPPIIVARGIDKRFPEKPRIYDLVSAWDGTKVGVGRIVADSSFHHYIDSNLKGLNAIDCCGNPLPGSDLDRIAQYYWNLVYWLAPMARKREIKRDLLFRAAFHPDVMEIWGTEASQLGITARFALHSQFGRSNLEMVFSTHAEEQGDLLNQVLSWLLLQRPSGEFAGIEPQLVLGSIIQTVHDFMEANKWYDPAWIQELPSAESFINRGLQLLKTSVPETDQILEKLGPLFVDVSNQS